MAFEAKNKVKNGTKNLPFEEAFLTHHIFFPQKVVVLWSPTQKTYFFAERICVEHKTFHHFTYLKVVVLAITQNNVTLTEEIGFFIKSCKRTKLLDLYLALSLDFWNTY